MLTSFWRLALRVMMFSVGRNGALISTSSSSFVFAYIFTDGGVVQAKSEGKNKIVVKFFL